MAQRFHFGPRRRLLLVASLVACHHSRNFSAPCASRSPHRGVVAMAGRGRSAAEFIGERLPGTAFVAVMAALAKKVASLSILGGIFSPLLYATLTGLLVGNTILAKSNSLTQDVRPILKPGVAFAKARLLRLGIILYGFNVSVQQILTMGPGSFCSALAMVFSTLAVGVAVGELLQVDRPVALLVATGASICGVSAVMAAAPVVEKEGASGSKVSVALATVMVFGIASMFLYPVMWPRLRLSAKAMGIYTGATVYEVAGVVAAGNAMSPSVASAALLTKLVRVLLLAPYLFIVSRLAKGGSTSIQTPWFAFAFFGVCVMSSYIPFPAGLAAAATKVGSWCTALAMVGLGLESDVAAIKQMGWRPMLLASIIFVYLVCGGFLVVGGILHILPV
ncbi:unnamed protein product [Symbiodinium natans]|uniref:Sulfate exporter family transporter n=1 Tax=Symbiodinium natans TaxID=878477 RepID=A0A812RG10_9DINO|nr:unnamed protein product [Symbiodinium natans]